MGAGKSKLSRGGQRSLHQEKHTSTESNTPLAAKAAELEIDRPILPEKNAIRDSEQTLRQLRTNTTSSIFQNDDNIAPIPIIKIHETEGHSDVTRPPPPPKIRTLSELIDPEDVLANGHIRSPSGNVLGAAEYLAQPGRPRSIRERQERIREKVRAASSLGLEIESPSELVEQPRRSMKRNVFCSCFCC